jgi:hypothetical protein
MATYCKGWSKLEGPYASNKAVMEAWERAKDKAAIPLPPL